MNEPVWSGGCLCGALQFHVSGDPRDACYCHCNSCRAAAGAPFVVWCTFANQALSISSGQLATYKSSDKVERGFCAGCGTTVTYFHEDRPDEIDISTTTLRDADRIPPLRHIWMKEKMPWLTIEDDLPKFARWS